VVLLALAGGVLELALLLAWQRNAYWSFSDGVYALTAREFLHGLAPYRDVATAQPPPVFLVGALLLAVSDTVTALDVGLGLVNLATAALVVACVWRLDGRVWLALLAGALAPLLPISLASHAQLVPETLAAPLILAGAFLCARSERQWLGAIVLALAAWSKFAFLIPALAVAALAPGRWRTVAWTVAAFVALFAISLAVFGTGVWDQTVLAQLKLGRATVHYAGGLLAQAAWNELPLLAGAALFIAIAWRERGTLRDRRLAATVTGAAGGGLLLALTVFKRGSYINVMTVAEPPLLVLAVCGAAWSWQRWRQARAVTVAATALLAAQIASLLINPPDPWVAVRPLAQSGLTWSAGPGQVNAEVTAARRCPPQLAYSGSPYIAFLASRRMPGQQPDVFMLANSREDATFARRAARDRPRCP
jgi:hypothetical protein